MISICQPYRSQTLGNTRSTIELEYATYKGKCLKLMVQRSIKIIVIGLFLLQVCDVFSSEITCLCDDEGEVLKCFLTSEALMVEDINMAGDQISLHHQDPLHPRQNTVNTGNFLAIFKHFPLDEGEIFFIFISIVGQKKAEQESSLFSFL